MKSLMIGSVLLFTACGDAGKDSNPVPPAATPGPVATATPEPSVPLTDDKIAKINWVAPDGVNFVKLGMHDKMFHMWLCADKQCSTGNLFFAVGQYNIKSPNSICFTDISFLDVAPSGFFIQKSLVKSVYTSPEGSVSTTYTTDDFCALARLGKYGKLSVTVKGDKEIKDLVFVNEGEYQ